MINLSHKAKQYLLLSLKVLILGGTFLYIYKKLSAEESETLTTFLNTFKNSDPSILYYCLIFLGLATINWMLEIFKWKILAQQVSKIRFGEAAKQSLSALTVSLITPNRIGEYGAKAIYFSPKKRKKILLLNFLGNGAQLIATILFGIIGFIFLTLHYDLKIASSSLSIILGLFLLFITLGFLFKERELLVKGFTISKVLTYFKNLPLMLKFKVLLISVCRYVVFSTLFVFLLRFFGSELDVIEALPLIFSMYLTVSIIPTLFIFDVVIRGGVAVWLFSLAEVSELIVLCTVLAMWILNFVIPSFIGSIFVARFKPL